MPSLEGTRGRKCLGMRKKIRAHFSLLCPILETMKTQEFQAKKDPSKTRKEQKKLAKLCFAVDKRAGIKRGFLRHIFTTKEGHKNVDSL